MPFEEKESVVAMSQQNSTYTTFPTLRSERLVLRAMREDDLERLCAYLGDFEVSKSLSTQPFPFSEADGRAYIMTARENDAAENMTWTMEFDGQLCGTFKVKDLQGTLISGTGLGKNIGQGPDERGFEGGSFLPL